MMPNPMLAQMFVAFLTAKLVTAEAAAVRAKDQAARDKIGERLEALISQWNAAQTDPKTRVKGEPYRSADFAIGGEPTAAPRRQEKPDA